MKQILHSQSGQSLVQVMIVGAVGIIIALGIATVMTNMQLSANGVKYRSDGDNFNEEMRALLSSPVACTNSFGGLVVGPAITFNIASIFDGSPAPGVLTYSAGNTYGDQSVLLSSMVLANYQIGGAPNTAMMTLTNNLTTKKRALGAQNLVRTINISLQVDNTNKITSCIALAKMSDGVWQRSTVNTNNIFFNGPPAPLLGGNVGIGTTNPASTLQIAGSLATNVNAQTSSYTLTAMDQIVTMNSGSATTVTLPTAAGITGRIYTIKNLGTGTVTVVTTGGQTIDGAATYLLSSQYQNVAVVSDGANWNIVSSLATSGIPSSCNLLVGGGIFGIPLTLTCAAATFVQLGAIQGTCAIPPVMTCPVGSSTCTGTQPGGHGCRFFLAALCC